jgi:Icc-related predicted phosphoesterase
MLEARMPDVICLTGDMLWDGQDPWTREPLVQSLQMEYWDSLYTNLRKTFPGLPILAVPGNHERIKYRDLEKARLDPLFVSFDTSEPKTVSIREVTFTGFRGTPEHGQRWHYELNEDAQDWILTELSVETQVLMTHTPPLGILDQFPAGVDFPNPATTSPGFHTRIKGPRMKTGAFKQFVKLHERLPKLEAHLFGHIHEQKGVEKKYGVTYSNASCGWNWVAI